MPKAERRARIFSMMQTLILAKSLDAPAMHSDEVWQLYDQAAAFVTCVEGIEKQIEREPLKPCQKPPGR